MEHHSLPVFFEKIEMVKDGRFTLAKVYIAHVGENRNRCYFSKEVLTSMIPSLTNIPVLAYVTEGEDGEMDFGNHEKVIVKKGKQMYLRYKGHAYGVVPAENNARFEFRYGEDGIEREYLVCDVLLWNKFDDAVEIIQNGNGFKSQSMELYPSSIKGYKDDNQIFVFEEAKFEGLCLLGDNVTPAMISSTIELFSAVQEDYKEMLTEFNTLFSVEKGEEMVVKKKNDDILVEDLEQEEVATNTDVENTTTENEAEETAPVDAVEPQEEPVAPANVEVEEVEAEEVTPVDGDSDIADGDADFAKKEEDEEEEKTDSEPEEEEEEEKKEKYSVTFELSHDDIRTGLYQALNNHEEFGEGYYWVSQVFDNHFLIEMDNDKSYKVNYVRHENAVSIGEYQEVFKMVVTADEKHGIEQHRATITQMEAELASLKEFKEGIEYAEKEDKLNSFAHILDKESFDTIKENLKDFSVVDIEKEVGLLVLRGQANFATNEELPSARVGVSSDGAKSNPYGSLSHYFVK